MYCSNCAAKIDPNERFCSNCGAPVEWDLEELAAQADVAPAKKRRPKKILFIAVSLALVVAILSGALVAVLLNVGNSSSKDDQSEEEDLRVVSPEVAALFGIDPDEKDSDGDGLDNYTEIYECGTHPAMVDSDEDGINDGDEDADGDGLTNLEEVACGTNLIKPDTDGDDLSDFSELNEFATSPVEYDTDRDTLGDGDEIALGLNPLVQKTDGVTLDSSREFTQQLSEEQIDDSLTSEDSLAVPSLTLTTVGNINSRVEIVEADSAVFGDTRAVVGSAIDISGKDLGEGTLAFSLKEDLKVECEYGYQTSLICKYNGDGSTEYLETEYDSANHALSADLSGEGTYFVLDVENLFDELGLALPASSGVSGSVGSVGVMAQADIIFLIDTTGSMEDEINHVKNNVGYFVDALKEKGVTTGLALIDYQDLEADGYDSTRVHKSGPTNWFYDVDAYKRVIDALDLGWGGDDPECAIDALETGRLLDMRPSAGKIFILVTDADYKVTNRYDIPSMDAEIELLKNAGVTCAVVSSSSYASAYYDLYTRTNGLWADINGDFYTELMRLADKIGTDIVGEGYWIYLDGPVPAPVRLDAEPVAGSKVDTDKDGIPDIEELEGAEPTKYIDLDDLLTRVSRGVITGTDYGMVMMYEYKSNPVEEDSDFDGTKDKYDDLPKENTFSGVLVNSFTEGINVEFSMDYSSLIDGSNTTYSKDKSTLAIVLSTMAYGGTIRLEKGANVSGNIETLFGALGLEGFADYSLDELETADGNLRYTDDDITEMIIGHRLVVYHGEQTEVMVVSIRGTDGTIKEWSSNFDVGADHEVYWDSENDEWKERYHHKGFDVAASRCYDLILEYINAQKLDPSVPKSIFLTGHSRGAAIANLLCKKLEDSNQFRMSAYTFATPNTTTVSQEVAESYDMIFNIVNEDDIVPCLPLESWGFTKYGETKTISVKKKLENKWAGAQEGTWEWLINANRQKELDYNFNGHLSDTIKAFEKLLPTADEASTERIRQLIYEQVNPYSDILPKDQQKLLILDKEYSTHKAATEDIENVQKAYGERLLRGCVFFVLETDTKRGKIYKIAAYQNREFFMMMIADLAGGGTATEGYEYLRGSLIGKDIGNIVAPLYDAAKFHFIWTAFDITGEEGASFARVGGMVHGHWTETYYLIAAYGVKE